jgi:hypothetical protein
MIRYLLPFAQSKEKDVAYNFYCYNNDVIFQPVTKSEELTIKISAKNVTEFDPSKNSQSNDELIDKLAGSKDLNVKDSGLKGFRLTTPVKSNKTADSGKTYDGDNIRSLKISMEDPKFKEIYISSFRKRILSLKKVISINTFLDTNITPMNLVEIVDQTEGQQGMLAGKFYVVSVTHHIPKGIDDPYIPYTQLVLSTDVEDKGNDSEGSPISSGGSATSAKAGNTSGSGGQAEQTFTTLERLANDNIDEMVGSTGYIFKNEVEIKNAAGDGFSHSSNGFTYSLYNGSMTQTLNSNIDAKRGDFYHAEPRQLEIAG